MTAKYAAKDRKNSLRQTASQENQSMYGVEAVTYNEMSEIFQKFSSLEQVRSSPEAYLNLFLSKLAPYKDKACDFYARELLYAAVNGSIKAVIRLGRADLAVVMAKSFTRNEKGKHTNIEAITQASWMHQFIEESKGDPRLVQYVAKEVIPEIPNAACRYISLAGLSKLVVGLSIGKDES